MKQVRYFAAKIESDVIGGATPVRLDDCTTHRSSSALHWPTLARTAEPAHSQLAFAAPNFAVPGAGDQFSRSNRPYVEEDPVRDAARHRVLIVEDEWFIAMESEAVLRSGGYAVVGIAATAEEAVSMAEQERPDLVLMDIRLRGSRDGIEAAVEIRDRFDIPCVFATAHAEPHLRERGAAAGPRGWLVKPFSEHQLLRAVRTALDRLG